MTATPNVQRRLAAFLLSAFLLSALLLGVWFLMLGVPRLVSADSTVRYVATIGYGDLNVRFVIFDGVNPYIKGVNA